MCSSAPDTSGINEEARQSAATSQDALNWYKGEMARTQGQRDQSTATQNAVAQAQLSGMNQQLAQAQDYADYNKNTFRPLEQQIVSESQNYNTPDRQAAAAETAGADVRAAQAGQQTAQAQSLARMGYSPLAASNTTAANNALAEAAAETAARRNVEATGHAMEMDAASLGRNLPSSQATAIQTGTQAGQAASGASSAAVNSQAQGAALMGQGYGFGLQGNQIAGNLYGQVAQLNQQDNSGLWGAIGNLGGAAISKWSSEKLKKPGAPMPDEVALESVRGQPRAEEDGASAGPSHHVEAIARMSNDTWQYKPGVEDGAVHVGPYAEESQARQGNRVAPRGKKMNLKAAADFNGEAIRELADRADRLERLLEHHS